MRTVGGWVSSSSSSVAAAAVGFVHARKLGTAGLAMEVERQTEAVGGSGRTAGLAVVFEEEPEVHSSEGE